MLLFNNIDTIVQNKNYTVGVADREKVRIRARAEATN